VQKTAITEQEILSQRTPSGGWTRRQLAAWGVPWPPPSGWKKEIIENGVPYSEVIEISGGGGIVAEDRPLFCRRCDGELSREYGRLWDAGAPTRDLVAVLDKRSSKIIEVTWSNGRRQWKCHYCGREAKVKR